MLCDSVESRSEAFPFRPLHIQNVACPHFLSITEAGAVFFISTHPSALLPTPQHKQYVLSTLLVNGWVAFKNCSLGPSLCEVLCMGGDCGGAVIKAECDACLAEGRHRQPRKGKGSGAFPNEGRRMRREGGQWCTKAKSVHSRRWWGNKRPRRGRPLREHLR